MPRCRTVSAPIASHPDMLLFRHNENIITSAEYCDVAAYTFTEIREACPHVRISFVDEVQEYEYPNDAIFNALVMGNCLFCREESVSRAVLEYARECGLKTVNVNQGYPACTTLKLNEEVAVTADDGMARALSENGIKVFKISPYGVTLPPYEYGFIGGAAGVHGGFAYFLGNLDTHPDERVIKDACRAARVAPVSLSTGSLTDLGGIVFIDNYVEDHAEKRC